RSSLGRRMISLRTTEVGASVRGVDLVSTKLAAFSISAALAGLAGVLYALEIQSVGPAPFNPLQSIFLLGLVVIAGQRSIAAALVAGILYGGIQAVDGVTCGVDAGEIVAVIGPNGAGKTTLLNAISGLTPLQHGQVLFEGRDLAPHSAHRRARMGLARTLQGVDLFEGL